ncbi:MAG TPA: hypothetical protein VFC78_13900 [Tepidisphaeraceae bacterium]|nr:hypothetical protein [Tepidisphaeraceae bacterium]
MMVVIGIIVVLIAILMPLLGRARDAAWAVKCQSNMSQLARASLLYAGENDSRLPRPNWVGKENIAGWLYRAPINPVQSYVQTGVFWQYIHDERIYRCPADSGPFETGPSRNLTSYLMNGAVIGYGNPTSESWRTHQMRPDGVMFWEADETGGAAWNDGSSYPWEGETQRHGNRGSCFACFDGHAEWWTHTEYVLQQNFLPGKLWCNPGNSNGQ